jgi:hypothetical protein
MPTTLPPSGGLGPPSGKPLEEVEVLDELAPPLLLPPGTQFPLMQVPTEQPVPS